jgi:aryl-alcohol dehydrogenase-like predicted oxidoreductase
MNVTRRNILQLGVAAGMLGTSRLVVGATPPPLITRAIPSTGEQLPVIGLGTNRYGVTAPDELAARREVLRRMTELGAQVIDTAPAYGRSEEVIGRLVSELKNRDRLWLATKVTAPSGGAAHGRKMPQLFLKYVVSHPAVTVAIPGTTKLEHLEDNLGAARGRLPDAAMRRRIETLFDAR